MPFLKIFSEEVLLLFSSGPEGLFAFQCICDGWVRQEVFLRDILGDIAAVRAKIPGCRLVICLLDLRSRSYIE